MGRAASRRLSQPSKVSWSVTAITVTPMDTAFSTSSDGDKTPSLKVECV